LRSPVSAAQSDGANSYRRRGSPDSQAHRARLYIMSTAPRTPASFQDKRTVLADLYASEQISQGFRRILIFMKE